MEGTSIVNDRSILSGCKYVEDLKRKCFALKAIVSAAYFQRGGKAEANKTNKSVAYRAQGSVRKIGFPVILR